MGGCLSREPVCLSREPLPFEDSPKKTAEVESFVNISRQTAGGSVRSSELNFLPLLSGSSGVSGDPTVEVWGSVVGPGKTVASAPGTLVEFQGNVLLGFLPYKGPTEKARMVMAFNKDPWLDCRLWCSWPALKKQAAGAPDVPTGCLPMLWDESLRTPSGACHRVSEWVAVDYYAAAKYGMVGRTAADLASILLLRDDCLYCTGLDADGDFEKFAFFEAALRTNSNSELLLGASATLADICLFNSLSHTYGNQAYRDKTGPLFKACFPKLVSFYHGMLTQHPHLREYLFSDAHTPAVYFMPWTLQQPAAYEYAAADNSDVAPSNEDTAVDSLPEGDRMTCTRTLERIRDCESLFPMVRDEHLSGWLMDTDFNTIYLQEALSDSNKIKDDLHWEFLQRSLKDMGVTDIKEHSGSSPPADGPLISWSRKYEMFILAVYVAARKGKFPLINASEGAKILQVVSTVRQLLGTWNKDAESFTRDACDKTKAGDTFSNVSPGNVLFLEGLLSLNEWKEGAPIIGSVETIADIYTFRFMELLDERILNNGAGLMSCPSLIHWNENFPLLNQFYKSKKQE